MRRLPDVDEDDDAGETLGTSNAEFAAPKTFDCDAGAGVGGWWWCGYGAENALEW